MTTSEALIPELDNDPVLRRLWRGEARTVHEAEEQYLNASMPAILELLTTRPHQRIEAARFPRSKKRAARKFQGSTLAQTARKNLPELSAVLRKRRPP